MRGKNQTTIAVVIAAIVLVIIAGLYSLLRPPAPKPAPAPEPPQQQQQSRPEKQQAPQPIKGVPQLDVSKYKTEPSVTVWLADKGQRDRMMLEKYIEGVIAQEMQPDWPLEALKAQAICSRTLTLIAMEAGTIRRLHQTDVSTAKEELQAFAPEKVNDTVREAVRATRGQVLLYAGGLVNSIYSSCNGQIAATREESFPTEIPHETPYFQPVTDTCFQYAPANIQRWTAVIPASQVANAIGYRGNPADIRILQKGPSGRILYIGAGDKKMYGSDFRRAVGYDRLKSTLVTEMRYANGSFHFTGLGWGNGVGLCQWGAYTFAKQGKKAEAMLNHYYPGAEIKPLWK
ncbi:MAG: SpoIID/LytB domain-containing protein [Sporomusaceae bacterium]|nr:SpoIID/LytB domain-containing protein [Sporomusaceae bacterium]